MNLRCKKCQTVFSVLSFEEVKIIQAITCEEGGSHVLSEVA
tara:strand:+ start:1031 stop:1153 length:123 start_codon:yes stop_codon:yes gene_type:complete